MNRRLFLQSLSAIALVKLPALPSYANVSTLVPTTAGGFVWSGPFYLDCGNWIALQLRLPNGRERAARVRFRYGCSDDEKSGKVLTLKRDLIKWADRMVKEGKA